MQTGFDDQAVLPETSLPLYTARRLGGLIALGFINTLLIIAAARMAYFPTDPSIARGVQSFSPLPLNWAGWITATAGMPWCFVLLSLTLVVAWLLSGWRAALIALPVFFGLWLFGIWLSPLIAQPRPSPALIGVVGHPAGYAFPSLFGLVYAATFGYLGLVAVTQGSGTSRVFVPLMAALALLIGACARIVMGAHWPSDLWVAYLIGLFWIMVLLPLSRRKPGPGWRTRPRASAPA